MSAPGEKGVAVVGESVAARNKTVVEAFFDAGSRGALDEVQSYMADDLVIRQAGFLPYGGTYSKKTFPALAAEMSKYIEMRNARLVRILADGDYVFAVVAVPDARTGQECIQGIQILLRDGKFAENTIFYHDAGSMAAPNP
jgi:ketosteroid isomerase-like protein